MERDLGLTGMMGPSNPALNRSCARTAPTDAGGDYHVLEWTPETGALAYNVYRGLLSALSPTDYGTCYRNGIVATYTVIPENPAVGAAYFYLVTAEMTGGEGTLGDDSTFTERPNNDPCP